MHNMKTHFHLRLLAIFMACLLGLSACSPSVQPYLAKLDDEIVANYHSIESFSLQFRYGEDYLDSDGKLTYQIFDETHQLVMSDKDQTLNPSVGDNRFKLDTQCCLNCHTLYTLVVSNQKKEKQYSTGKGQQ